MVQIFLILLIVYHICKQCNPSNSLVIKLSIKIIVTNKLVFSNSYRNWFIESCVLAAERSKVMNVQMELKKFSQTCKQINEQHWDLSASGLLTWGG